VVPPKAWAAVRHFASSAKSRKDVVVPTPPVAAPLTMTVTRIKVHMWVLRHWYVSRR
jgi:hypothetical protein